MMSSSMKLFTAIVLLCTTSMRYSDCHNLPNDFGRCKPTDNDCLLKRCNEVVRAYPNGFPELFLDPIDPMPIDDIRILGNPNSQVNLNLEMTQLMIHGNSKVNFTKINGFTNDPKDITKLDFESVHPELIIKGQYKVSGKILILPITGEGEMVLTLKMVQTKAQMKPLVEMRDGKAYLKSDVYKLKNKPNSMHIYLANLFNNDKNLGDNILKVMNENWQLLSDEINPEFVKQIVKANVKILDKIFSKLSYDELFLTS